MLSQNRLIDGVHMPEDLRRLPESDLRQLADELREETISAVSVTGGHLGAGLGVVELTVALHYIFDTPHDRLILPRCSTCLRRFFSNNSSELLLSLPFLPAPPYHFPLVFSLLFTSTPA